MTDKQKSRRVVICVAVTIALLAAGLTTLAIARTWDAGPGSAFFLFMIGLAVEVLIAELTRRAFVEVENGNL